MKCLSQLQCGHDQTMLKFQFQSLKGILCAAREVVTSLQITITDSPPRGSSSEQSIVSFRNEFEQIFSADTKDWITEKMQKICIGAIYSWTYDPGRLFSEVNISTKLIYNMNFIFGRGLLIICLSTSGVNIQGQHRGL